MRASMLHFVADGAFRKVNTMTSLLIIVVNILCWCYKIQWQNNLDRRLYPSEIVRLSTFLAIAQCSYGSQSLGYGPGNSLFYRTLSHRAL